jgi:hypothetical protein
VFSAFNNALVSFDISNPANPVGAGSTVTGLNAPTLVYVQGHYAYVTSENSNALVVFDITNPASPVFSGSATAGLSAPFAVFVQGRYAYVTSYANHSLVIFDIANPASPVYAGSSNTGLFNPNAVHVQGRYAYVSSENNNTLAVFDVSNPAAPVNVGSSATALNDPHSVFVQGRYAYVASSFNNGLASFDLGGAYVQQLETGGLETGTLSANGDVQLNGDALIKGGLSVGNGGVISDGAISSPMWQSLTPLAYAGGALSGFGRTSASFTTHGGRLQVFASATAYTATASTLLKVDLYLDATLSGTLLIYANEAGSHKALAPLQVTLAGIAPGGHTVTLKNGNGTTVTDGTDYSEVTLTELPF